MLLYVYQNARALQEAQAYVGCNYALMALSLIHATLAASNDASKVDGIVSSGVQGGIDDSLLDNVSTVDEETLALIIAMDGVAFPIEHCIYYMTMLLMTMKIGAILSMLKRI
jgi:hypothetical protein